MKHRWGMRWMVPFFLAVCGSSGGMEAIADNSDCFLCHDDAELARREGGSLHVPPAAYEDSTHGTLACVDCHTQLDVATHPDAGADGAGMAVRCDGCHEAQGGSFGRSAHGMSQGQGEGNATAIRCSECHGAHNIRSPADLRSPLHFLNLTETCGRCHETVAADICASVHGSELARGRRESPVCTDCHMEHAVAPLSAAAAIKQSGEVCAQCHSGERLNAKYGIAANAAET